MDEEESEAWSRLLFQDQASEDERESQGTGLDEYAGLIHTAAGPSIPNPEIIRPEHMDLIAWLRSRTEVFHASALSL
jgi:hypothetical protein